MTKSKKSFSQKLKEDHPDRWSDITTKLHEVFSDVSDASDASLTPISVTFTVSGILVDEKPSEGAFFSAVEEGDALAMLALLERGIDPNIKRKIYGDTALHIAAAGNAKAVVRILAETGNCDFKMKDRKGLTAAQIAYMYGGNPALSRYLRLKAEEQDKLS